MTQRIEDVAVSSVQNLLAQGRSAEAARLFVELQQRGALPRGRRAIRWIKSAFGADLTKSLILGFAHQACVFCKKGLLSCERCAGKGHLDYAFVCEDCFGLGVRTCRFCNGTGLATWDFVPEGLRLVVLAERTRAAVNWLRDRQHETGAKTRPFLQAVHVLLAVNRDMGVLENAVTFADRVRPQSAKEKEMIRAVIHSAVEFAALAQQQRMTATKEIISAVESLSQDATMEPNKRAFEKDRMKFYRSACEAEPPFEGTFLRHPLLEDRIAPNASSQKPGSPNAEPEGE